VQTPWGWLKSIARVLLGDDPRRQERFFVPYAVAGLYLSPDEALSLAAVWGCMQAISNGVSPMRWGIFQPELGGKRKTLLVDDPRMWMLNTRPNPEMTAIAFREALLFQAIPWGNAYAEIVRDRRGLVAQLWPLFSDRVRPRRNPDTWALEYHCIQVDGSTRILGSEDVFHLRGPGIGGLMGDNLIARAAKSIGVAAAQERFSASFFGQGAQMTGFLKFPGRLDKARADQLKEDWNAKKKGPENAHKMMILESGMDYVSNTVDPQKSQLIEGRQFSVEEICRWFGVPPHKVQHLLHATFSNIEHSSIEFVRDTLTPWATRLQQEADYKLFDTTRGPWKETLIDLRPQTRGDALSRSQAQGSWRQNGILTANEIRAEEGYDDVGPDGDVLLVQGALKTLDQVINPPEPVAPAPAPGAPGDPDGDQADDQEDAADPADGDQKKPAKKKAAADVARRVMMAAISSSLERYGRRLKNRKAGLKIAEGTTLTEEQRAELLAFRGEQFKTIAGELEHFTEFALEAVGRGLTEADAALLASVYEQRSSEAIDVVVLEAVRALPA
jgi:HK97 family phage portal protein